MQLLHLVRDSCVQTCLTGAMNFLGGTQATEWEVHSGSWGNKLSHLILLPFDLNPARNQKVGVHPLNPYWLVCTEAERRVERQGERIWKAYKDIQHTITW